MNKISEVIKIKSGMASFVNLCEEFFDEDKSKDRIQSYKPIKSHREVFWEISKSMDPINDRCFFLSGSYGTGKSHLCLMLSYYFFQQASAPELQEFFKTYEFEDPAQAKVLMNKRLNGRYLVVLPDYSQKGDFESIVLKALDKTLKQEDFDKELDFSKA